MALKYLMCLVVLLTGMSAFGENLTPVTREEHKVVVDGVEEHWRLEWATPPSPACSPDEPDVWSTCPCSGFAFGERGNLVLVRKKPGGDEERFALTQLFAGDFDAPGNVGEVVLRRWDVQEEDMDQSDSPDFAERVQARPPATVMRFGDYDHDGQATEFLLQVGTLPCGKKMSVAIGVSRQNPRLHAFQYNRTSREATGPASLAMGISARSKGPDKGDRLEVRRSRVRRGDRTGTGR